ncbi:MAG: inositol monophosphatase [Chloroflexi bacterium]|nr:inositol monophosphatase [Chloroflexota bacterium]
MSADLDAAIEAARIAADLLVAAFGGVQQIRHKGEIDLVTEADEAAEAAIVASLRSSFPTDGILAEEGTGGGTDPNRLWIVDPLDGTTNFAHGYPVFCVSIALEVDGIVEVGVVYQPMLRELFTATRGGGAFLDDRRLKVSETDALRQSLLVTGFSYDQALSDQELAVFGRFHRRAQAIRRDGAAALNLAYVAAGRFDGFWEASVRPWDVAAGTLMVTEAGGHLSDFRGGPCDIRGSEFVATNGRIHQQVVTTITPP